MASPLSRSFGSGDLKPASLEEDTPTGSPAIAKAGSPVVSKAASGTGSTVGSGLSAFGNLLQREAAKPHVLSHNTSQSSSQRKLESVQEEGDHTTNAQPIPAQEAKKPPMPERKFWLASSPRPGPPRSPSPSQVSQRSRPSSPTQQRRGADKDAEIIDLREEIRALQAMVAEIARQPIGAGGAPRLAPQAMNEAARSGRHLASIEAAIEELRKGAAAQQKQHDLTAGALTECLLEINTQRDVMSQLGSSSKKPPLPHLQPNGKRPDEAGSQDSGSIAELKTAVGTEFQAQLSSELAVDRAQRAQESSDMRTYFEGLLKTAVQRTEKVEQELADCRERWGQARTETSGVPEAVGTETRAVITATVQACEMALKGEISRCMREVESELRDSLKVLPPLADRISAIEVKMPQPVTRAPREAPGFRTRPLANGGPAHSPSPRVIVEAAPSTGGGLRCVPSAG